MRLFIYGIKIIRIVESKGTTIDVVVDETFDDVTDQKSLCSHPVST